MHPKGNVAGLAKIALALERRGDGCKYAKQDWDVEENGPANKNPADPMHPGALHVLHEAFVHDECKEAQQTR